MLRRFVPVFAFLAVASPALAAQPFDGSWNMNAATRSGNCGSYAFDVGISDGRIQTPPGVSIGGSGNVSRAGRVAVQFTAGTDVISATGQARDGMASGNWNAASLGCSGSWSAQRR